MYKTHINFRTKKWQEYYEMLREKMKKKWFIFFAIVIRKRYKNIIASHRLSTRLAEGLCFETVINWLSIK